MLLWIDVELLLDVKGVDHNCLSGTTTCVCGYRSTRGDGEVAWETRRCQGIIPKKLGLTISYSHMIVLIRCLFTIVSREVRKVDLWIFYGL